MDEWGDTLMYDNSTKCIYSIANDDRVLYIAIKATDRIQQMKMIQGGMQIWVDSKAKRNKSTGIKFPAGSDITPMPAGRSSGKDSKEMRQQLKSQLLTMELTGFNAGLNGLRSVYESTEVRRAIEWDSKDNLIYELAISFNALDETLKANLRNISIGIFIKGLNPPQGSAGGLPESSAPPGGMRPGGGGRMPDQSQMVNITKDNFFWKKYTIKTTDN